MNIVRAWKDPEYRAQLAEVPTHPAGLPEMVRVELTELDGIAGAGTETGLSLGCCNSFKTFTTTLPIICTFTLSVC
ncbi:mersacidin/lichenicidin family type 2 lantibiotic [Amycolatopsis sp. 195334CR]|uniref:mersacidin/lichenicidin family type 2 lantibiotic n=1 Tax=Amycolatopsis sp. 195334CR TaxID=2814588 RepID=UPI001A90131B|nr:mersacidin/lichenicidin family type 2 lantibiotic [Amycolatopsis sp. 195334CR]MBN6033676.1 mersacidin/lichenicidin family type 2 lantibiotic [Amycolatopsis sp. 195334CR]